MKILSHDKIIELYERFIKTNYTEEYKTRYVPLPTYKNNKKWRWEGKDFPRVIALLEFERYIEKYNFQISDLLIFNGQDDPEIEYLGNRIKTLHNFDYMADTVNYDLHQLKLPRTDYDFVCLHQTLEHIYNPYQCLTNIYNHMKTGGYLYVNVPACNAPHSEPFHHFTGFTPVGLVAISDQVGFNVLESGQWGNEEYLVKLWTRQPGWSDFTQLQNPGINEIQNPVITWVLLQK
jgi:SAM-dependent methyltransferase